ncbi:MAG: GspE/PulE family protein [Pseudomonadota bacterium]|jgi:general secretion pathway protein E
MSATTLPPTAEPVLSAIAATAPGSRVSLEAVVADLSADGIIDAPQAESLLRGGRFSRSDLHPLVIVAEQKWKDPRPGRKLLSLDSLTEWFAGKAGLPYLKIDPFKVDFAAVTQVMSNAYATRFRILPVAVSAREVTLATCEPFMTEWEPELRHVLKRELRRVIASPADISTHLVEFYTIARSVKGASAAQSGAMSALANLEQLVQLGKKGSLDANDAHVVSLTDWLMHYAFEQRASDIHLEPRRDVGNIRFRIDGVMHPVYQVPTPVMAAMVSRIKVLGRMDVVEKRRPQDGRIKTLTPENQEVELRLSTMPTAFGEKLVMRIFDPEVLLRDYKDLGFSEDDLARWNSMVTSPNGIVLVTGPTGSGKTTTLYSTLKHLASEEVNVCTVEDPIEMIEPAFNQMQVQHNIGLDFASGIRTLLRQDPDIIMVGEIRDLETAEMAIQASLTGHLVLSTLHTNDAPSAITRLLDIGMPPYLLHATVLGVMAQRLVRTLCPHCREPAPLDDEAWNLLVSPWKARKPDRVWRSRGCLECRMTGYRGRTGLYELMLLTPSLRRVIQAGSDLQELGEQAARDGMRPLRISGAMKVAAGLTTVEEVLKVAPPLASRRERGG